MSLERIVGTHNSTGVIGMKQQSCWGVWFFKRPQVSPLAKQGNWQHDSWCLITSTWAKRVAVVNSVITIYLTLANIGWSLFTLQYIIMFSTSVCNCYQFICYYLSVVICDLANCFNSNSFISAQSPLVLLLLVQSFVWLLSVILCSDTGIVFQLFWSSY